jgi:hypothetical protein
LTTLEHVLRARGLDPARMRAYRLTLHPADRSDDFRTLADVVAANAVGMYQRLHDGRRLGAAADVLTFVARPGGRAVFWGYHRFMARRQGVVPGDIVYDYDAYHLLHPFIARARRPVFYDALPLDGLDDLAGKLVLRWPRPLLRSIVRADDDGLLLDAVPGADPLSSAGQNQLEPGLHQV